MIPKISKKTIEKLSQFLIHQLLLNLYKPRFLVILSINLLGSWQKLSASFNLYVDSFFNTFILYIQVFSAFIQLSHNKEAEAIPKIPNKNILGMSGNKVEILQHYL